MGECCSEKYESGCCQESKSECCQGGHGEEKSGCCSQSQCSEATSGCCGEKSCCDGYCDESRMMKALSDSAWSCLMKDKIKKAYEEKMGKQMDAAAQVCADHAMKMYGMKQSGHAEVKSEIESFRKKLGEAFSKK